LFFVYCHAIERGTAGTAGARVNDVGVSGRVGGGRGPRIAAKETGKKINIISSNIIRVLFTAAKMYRTTTYFPNIIGSYPINPAVRRTT